ncbi:MAG: hypothetical protein U0R17_00935 [Acidimicrobiia bacterium]
MSDFIEGETLQGEVLAFDEHVGLGEIETKDERLLPFHCINIADGTRKIALHAKVEFKVHFHPRGRYEAVEIYSVT